MTTEPPDHQAARTRGLNNKQIKQSLKYATLEGGAAAGMVGFSEQYVTPFALAAQATPTQIGLLNSIPNLLTIFFTLKAQSLVDKIGSRKKTIMLLVFMDIFSVFPLLFVPLFVGKNFFVWFGLLSFYYFFPPIMINPIWGNLMADIVPPKRMGKYFSRRSALVGASTLVCSSVAAAILSQFGDATMMGFTIIFAVAVVFRVVSFLCYAKVYEPPMHPSTGQPFGFIDFVKETRSSSLVRFILFICLMNFTLNLAGPFHAVYLINTLNLSYMTYMVIINASAVATMVTLGFWGRRADRYGNVRVIKTSAYLMPIAPILWLVSGNPVFLVGAQLLAGFAWAGFNLCGPNYIYEASPKERRGKYLAYFSAVNIAALSLGAMAGGFLGNVLPPIKGSGLLTLFLLTGMLRLGIALFFVPRFQEVRFARDWKHPALFYNSLSVSPMVRGGLFHNPLAYKPIVAAAQTFSPRPTSPYSPFYQRVVRFVVDTAAQRDQERPRGKHDLFHNKDARKIMTPGVQPGDAAKEPSPWTPFRNYVRKKREGGEKPSPIVGDDLSIAEQARRHLEMLRRRARAKQGPANPEVRPVSLYYNKEMQKQWEKGKKGTPKETPSSSPLHTLPRERPPSVLEKKVHKRGLFYRMVSWEDLVKKKKKPGE
ncbi:MAG: MFS transporter [Chloroflexi bacterium]|nr:MFS transporter [Chloroflexota bacterium]